MEFKRSTLLNDSGGQERITRAVVALANRDGGLLLIGIKDDGGLEGRFRIGISRAKQIVESICNQSISPPVRYKLGRVSCQGCDIIAIEVPPRETIPHAAVQRDRSGAITHRQYWIRTPHGTQTVTDHQLAWMFREREDAIPERHFVTPIVFKRGSPDLVSPGRMVPPPYSWDFSSILKRNDNSKESSAWEWGDLRKLVVEAAPFAAIHWLSRQFIHAWRLVRRKNLGTTSWSPVPRNLPSQTIALGQLPGLPRRSTLRKLGLTSDQARERSLMIKRFALPAGSRVSLGWDNDTSVSWLKLQSSEYSVAWEFRCNTMGAGPGFGHPLFIVEARVDGRGQEALMEAYVHVNIECTMRGTINFGDLPAGMSQDLLAFLRDIWEEFDNDWNFENYLSKVPSPDLLVIERKVDTVFAAIQRLQDVSFRSPTSEQDNPELM